jgi:hypothetical protein
MTVCCSTAVSKAMKEDVQIWFDRKRAMLASAQEWSWRSERDTIDNSIYQH